MSERIAEIEDRLDRITNGRIGMTALIHNAQRDYAYLLQRVEELEAENERHISEIRSLANVLAEHKATIGRLRSKLEAKDNRIAEIRAGGEW